MSAKGKAGLALLCLGAVMLIAALALYQNNQHESLEAEVASQEVMTQLIEVITSEKIKPPLPDEELSPAYVEDTTEEPSPAYVEDTTMETVEIDGYRYVGFLTIPDLGVELPVMEDWDYDRLRIAPCRYSGTLLGGDLVIAAHNYERHFGHLRQLSIGSEVIFTDVNGNSTCFSVAELEILQPTEIEYMTSADYDLTLFTCTYGGATRFTARCVRENG